MPLQKVNTMDKNILKNITPNAEKSTLGDDCANSETLPKCVVKNLPLRRSTRLKSECFESTFLKDLTNAEYEIKDNFNKSCKKADKKNRNCIKTSKLNAEKCTLSSEPIPETTPKCLLKNIPVRRSTRLKSVSFVNTFDKDLPDDEYDINRKNSENLDIPCEKLDAISKECEISSKPTSGIFTFFGKQKNYKTSKCVEKNLVAGADRSETNNLLNPFPRDAPDGGAYDINNENFENSNSEIVPVERRINIAKSNVGKNDSIDKNLPSQNEKQLKNVEPNVDLTERKQQNKATRYTELKKCFNRNANKLTETSCTSQKAKKRGRRSSVSKSSSKQQIRKNTRNSIKNSTNLLYTSTNQQSINDDENFEKSAMKSAPSKKRGRKPKTKPDVLKSNGNNLEGPSQKVRKVASISKKRNTRHVTKSKGNDSVAKKVNVRSQSPNQRLEKYGKCKTYTKISKIRKEETKMVTTRKIPKDRLEDALDMMNNDNHPIWEDRNISCNPSIHHYWQTYKQMNSENRKIKYARQFLLRRDWFSLSKVILSFTSSKNFYFQLLFKYATLLMAHTDKEQFNKIVQLLANTTDTNSVLKACTKYQNKNLQLN